MEQCDTRGKTAECLCRACVLVFAHSPNPLRAGLLSTATRRLFRRLARKSLYTAVVNRLEVLR